MYYSTEERREMLEIYLTCNKNKSEAKREYIRRNPNRTAPSRSTFQLLYEKFVATNSLVNRKRTKEKPVVDRDMELNVLLYFVDDPSRSTRSGAAYFGISQRSVVRILKANHYKPYHVLPVQKLSATDRQNRVSFCELMLDRIHRDDNFLKNIFWTDESSFSTAGVFNRKNTHIWSTENPRNVREIKKQGHGTVNVWCGIHNDMLYGPVFIDGVLTGAKYLNLLRGEIEGYLDNMPINQMQRVIWQQDGAPPHNDHHVRNYLMQRFPIWIGRNGAISWPPRSPDLTPMDFSIWGAIKQHIYGERLFNNTEELKLRIREEVETINASPGTFQRIRQNIITRFNICLQNHGGYIENVL